MLSIRTLASGSISFTNYAPIFLPVCRVSFIPGHQATQWKERPEHPVRKPGPVAEVAGIPSHTMPPHLCCVMKPKCSFHISRVGASWMLSTALPAPILVTLLPKNAAEKGTNPAASAPCFGSKLVEYVGVSMTMTLFVGRLNTVRGRGLARTVKFNRVWVWNMEGKVIF